ncbi:hypothetical protein JCM14124_01630 [Humidesulfovibrio idahonensis]
MLKKIEALVQGQGHCALATCPVMNPAIGAAVAPACGGTPVAHGGMDVGAPGGVQGGRGAGMEETPADIGPHVSLMAYCAAPNAGEFWLATLKDTRKYRNLLTNPRASLLIDDRTRCTGAPSQALTVSAVLQPFANAQNRESARQKLLLKHPNMLEFLANDDVLLLRFVALRLQLLSGLTEVFVHEVEKKLDGSGLRA